MNLILIQPGEVDAAGVCILTGKRAEHICSVLNAAVGMTLRIGLLDGPLGSGVVEQVDSGHVVLHCTFEHRPPPEPRIDLLLAMPRPKVMKRLWAQLAALGVGRIVLIRAEKVERYYFDSHVVEPGFYTDLLIEGLQQARCTHLPDVLVRPRFKPFVEDELDHVFPDSFKVLADPSGEMILSQCLGNAGDPQRVVLAIGPEGGWTPYELSMLRERGFHLIGMGGRILRTDTAVVGLLSILHEVLSVRDV